MHKTMISALDNVASNPVVYSNVSSHDEADVMINVAQNAGQLPSTHQLSRRSGSRFFGRVVRRLELHGASALYQHKRKIRCIISMGISLIGSALGYVVYAIQDRYIQPLSEAERNIATLSGFFLGTLVGLPVTAFLAIKGDQIEQAEAERYSLTLYELRTIKLEIEQITKKSMIELYLQLPISQDKVDADTKSIILHDTLHELKYPVIVDKGLYDFFSLIISIRDLGIIPHNRQEIGLNDFLCLINDKVARVDC